MKKATQTQLRVLNAIGRLTGGPDAKYPNGVSRQQVHAREDVANRLWSAGWIESKGPYRGAFHTLTLTDLGIHVLKNGREP
jgi:hypothetical protein